MIQSHTYIQTPASTFWLVPSAFYWHSTFPPFAASVFYLSVQSMLRFHSSYCSDGKKNKK